MNLRFPNKIASFFNCPTKGTKTTKVFVENPISHIAQNYFRTHRHPTSVCGRKQKWDV